MARILIVDDSADTAQMLRMFLPEHRCDVATGGTEALDKYAVAKTKNEPYQLLILDLAMPRPNGLEVAETIRSTGDDHTRLVLFSAHAQQSTLDLMAARNVEIPVWEKPMDIESFRAKVAELLVRG